MGLEYLPTVLPLNNPVNVGQDTSSIDPMGIQGCQFFRNKAVHSLGKGNKPMDPAMWNTKKQLPLRKDESKDQKILCFFLLICLNYL